MKEEGARRRRGSGADERTGGGSMLFVPCYLLNITEVTLIFICVYWPLGFHDSLELCLSSASAYNPLLTIKRHRGPNVNTLLHSKHQP